MAPGAGLPGDENHAGTKNVRGGEEKGGQAFNPDFDSQEIQPVAEIDNPECHDDPPQRGMACISGVRSRICHWDNHELQHNAMSDILQKPEFNSLCRRFAKGYRSRVNKKRHAESVCCFLGNRHARLPTETGWHADCLLGLSPWFHRPRTLNKSTQPCS